jgi:flavin-dependent dehydrogenase/Pyruvate/2-oxoacid:ferredoxin oxidoreductase delta subunit
MSNVVILDSAKCNGCSLCVQVCPEMVFTQEEPHGVASLSFPERCLGCLACEEDCAQGAIRVHRLPAGMTAEEAPAPGAGLDPGKLYDLVVIGAGPAGLGAAIRGRMLGLDVAVIERLPSLRRSHHPDGGLIFCHESMYKTERTEAGIRVVELDVTIPASDVRDQMHHFIFMGPDGLATKRSKAGALSFDVIPKDRLVERLAQRALELGAAIAYNTRAGQITTGDGCKQVTIDGGVTIRGRVVISAEGITGRLAHKAGAPVSEFPVGWSYAVLAALPPLAQPVDEVGFVMGPVAGLEERLPFLSYWASGRGGSEIATGPLQKGKTRGLKRRLSAYLAHVAERDTRITDRVGEPFRRTAEVALDGCRIFARRLPRSAVADRVIAAGDAFTTCGMLTNFTSLYTGDCAARVAHEALARGDTSAQALAAFDNKVLRLPMVQGMKWMHNLLIEAPLELSADDLRALFKMLQKLDLGSLMGGHTSALAAFYAQNAFAMMRKPNLRRFLTM